jgi:hypothetical protein
MSDIWTFERAIETAKLGALVVGGFFALFPWWYNFQEQRHKARRNAERPWEAEFPLSIQKVKDLGNGTFLYLVEMIVRVKNISTSAFDLSYAVAELFVGRVDLGNVTASHDALIANPPPSPWRVTEGAIRWMRKRTVIGISGRAEEHPESMEWLRKTYPGQQLVPWDGLTGPVSSGTSVQDSPSFFIAAHPEDYVAMTNRWRLPGRARKV